MKISKILPLYLPILISFLVSLAFAFDYGVQFPESLESLETPSAPIQPKVTLEPGIWNKIQELEILLNELTNRIVPPDTEPEETKESLGRILVGLKLVLFLLVFLILLGVSTSISFWSRAWFHKTVAYLFYPISILFLFPKLFYSMQLALSGSYGFWIMLALYSIGFFGSIFCLRYLWKDKAPYEGFLSLQYSSSLEEEGRSPTDVRSGSRFSPIFHIAGIILIGILIGNLVYMPIFLLQKHYSSEFGSLIFILLVALSLFYIFNYKKVGGDPKNNLWQNLLVSFAYLQYRFLRNGFFAIFTTFVLVLFVTFLFSLLLLNIDIIQNQFGLLEKNTAL